MKTTTCKWSKSLQASMLTWCGEWERPLLEDTKIIIMLKSYIESNACLLGNQTDGKI